MRANLRAFACPPHLPLDLFDADSCSLLPYSNFPATRSSWVSQAPGRLPSSAAIFPTRESAPLPSRKALLDTMYMARWHRVSMTLVRRKLDKKPSALDRTTEMMMMWSSLPSSARVSHKRNRTRALCVQDVVMRTLEGVDIKTLVLPLQVFFSKCLFKGTSLGIIRGDYSVFFILFLQVMCEVRDRLDLFPVLKICIKTRLVSRSRARPQNTSTTRIPTSKLLPSWSSCSDPSTSTNRHAMVLDGTTWPECDSRLPSYTCSDMKSPI